MGTPQCSARAALRSVLQSVISAVSHCVSIAILVPATRWKGSGHDEFVALVLSPLTFAPIALDHLLLSCRQVPCHPYTFSFQLLSAFGKDIHFVGPLGKLGNNGLWSGVAVAVLVAVAETVCTDDVITGPLFIRHSVLQEL